MAETNTAKKHFVLVHGACHGAWCWYRVVVLLEKHGHKVTAVDLAACGRDVDSRLEDFQTIDDYHKPLYSFLEGLPADGGEDKVILVGHSYGCYAVSSAMERFPEKISWGVFVSGYMVGPELSIEKFTFKLTGQDNLMDTELKTVEVNGKTQTHMTSGKRFLAAHYYQNSPPEVKTQHLSMHVSFVNGLYVCMVCITIWFGMLRLQIQIKFQTNVHLFPQD
ncbi:OLC1v1035690C1 [Oldenlandia corymbosa var. corymbosa]|uniref:OLC1v1035690C1 n=1 Tax=Oldenlandia corymbosa var. corymbosa TaxID=529605 RepID=A0AAV1CTM3_OLDCO|nr:OLC1v1035690C1 [Oldenlandia corymbosa var. corymbosa]